MAEPHNTLTVAECCTLMGKPIPKPGDHIKVKVNNELDAFDDFVDGELAVVIALDPTVDGLQELGSIHVQWLTNVNNVDPKERIDTLYPSEYDIIEAPRGQH